MDCIKKRLLPLLLAALFLLVGCRGKGDEPTEGPAPSQSVPTVQAAELLPLLANAKLPVTEEFLTWCAENTQGDLLAALASAIKAKGYSDLLFYQLTGETLHVLYDRYTGAVDSAPNIHQKEGSGGKTTLAFTGDVNLADDWENMVVYRQKPGGIKDCITGGLLEEMQAADILLVNNEFSYSKRGAPLKGKLYTFRAAPENVSIMKELGADIVGLANNHVYDYGDAAFLDTLQTLDDVGIVRVGAGKNIEEAMEPQYFIVSGMKIAFVAATRAEKFIMTPEATETKGGVLRTYDPERFCKVIEAAKENADFVVAYVHWGTENSHQLEPVQRSQGKAYIDAGADLVVGAHPHCLQGMEYYRGKPIVYSLGNFWFNIETIDTGLLMAELDPVEGIQLTFLPCLQKSGVTTLLPEGKEKERILNNMAGYSIGVDFGQDGTVIPGKE